MRKYTQGKCKCTRNHPHVVKKWDKVKHSATYWDLTKWAGGFKTSFKSTKYCAWQEKCILPGPLKPTQANCGNMNEMLRLPWRDFRSENGHGTTSRELLGYSTLPAPFFALACRYSRNALRTWKSFYPATMIQWIPPDFCSFSCVVPAMQTTCEWPQAGTSSLLWLRKPLRNHTVPGKWFLVTDYNQHRLQVAPGQAMNQHGLDLNAKRILSSLSRGTCNMSLEIQRLFAIGNLRLAKSVSAFLKHGSAKLARGPMQTNPQLFQQALSVCPFTVYSVVFTCTQRHKTPSCAMKSLSICFWGPVLRWAVSESALLMLQYAISKVQSYFVDWNSCIKASLVLPLRASFCGLLQVNLVNRNGMAASRLRWWYSGHFSTFFLIFGVDHFSSVISLKKTKSYFSALAPWSGFEAAAFVAANNS